MEEGGLFNRLASELTLKERKELLARLSSQSELTREPLYAAEEGDAVQNLKRQYEGMPWYLRLLYFLLGLIRAKPPLNAYEDRMVARLGGVIDSKRRGLYNYRRELLLPEFYRELTNLKESSRFFYTALDVSVNRDKGAFFAFLGSLELPDLHQRLLSETDPALIAQNSPWLPEAEVHQTALKTMDEIFGGITDEQRNFMYFNARCLFCLKELSAFLYDRLLAAFSFDSALGQVCSARLVQEQLMSLNNILYSMPQVPAMTLLESLFVFMLQDQMGDIAFDVESETKTMLSRAEVSLTGIRNFNKNVPLTLILRCAARKLDMVPRAISGGEDWFIVYRDYWKGRIDGEFKEYAKSRKQAALTELFHQYLKGSVVKPLANAASERKPGAIPVAGSQGLAFLLAFYEIVFIPDLNKILRPILLDGEFYKRENRTQFTEAYNDLMKIGDTVRKFDARLSAEGDYGKRYEAARGEMSSLSVKRRKIQMVVQEASEESMKMITGAREAFKAMVQVLDGILRKDSAGVFDTISNLQALGGKNSAALTSGIDQAVVKLESALKLLDEVNFMEAGK
jgi:heme oxygenase